MPIHNAKAARAINEAATLQRVLKEGAERLEELKSIIRECAETVATKRGDDEKVEFESDEGVASVCFPRDAVNLVKGADVMKVAGDAISDKAFTELFIEKTVYSLSDNFEAAFAAQPKNVQKVVSVLIETKPRAPRVTLPK